MSVLLFAQRAQVSIQAFRHSFSVAHVPPCPLPGVQRTDAHSGWQASNGRIEIPGKKTTDKSGSGQQAGETAGLVNLKGF
jgi:hypothetical protein